LDVAMGEYSRYKYGNYGMHPYSRQRSESQIFSDMINDALEAQIPSLAGLQELYRVDREEHLKNELASSGFEEFGKDERGEAFLSEGEAEKWIEESAKNIDLADYMYYENPDDFLDMLSNTNISREQFVIDLNQYVVFPLWYDHWSGMGIDSVRDDVEQIYEMLTGASTLNDEIVAINAALNAVHVNGLMIEYLEDNVEESGLQGLFQELTEGRFINEWNEELHAAGVQLPESVMQGVGLG